MARFIDANVFIEALKNADADVCEAYPDNYCDWGFSRKAIEDLLQNIPTVEAVEVVRCGECISHEKEACPKGAVWCKTMCRYMKPDGFCSEGRVLRDEKKADQIA